VTESDGKPWRTLAGGGQWEEEVRHSRFIGRAARADSPDEAMAFLHEVSHPKATHNCWAFRIGPGCYRSSDDGEPGGTAGRPILAAIDHSGLDHVVVVVTRYFGGIKLGSGGLTRAYGGVAAEALRAAPQVEVRPLTEVAIIAPFELTGVLYQLTERLSAQRVGEDYLPDSLILTVRLEVSAVPRLEAELRAATHNRATLARR